jgi:hypothetical protein
MTRCVLQPWVLALPFMQQTVLLTAVRGPDGVAKYGPTKMLLRWYRRCTLLSAMDGRILGTPYELGGGSFTGPSISGGNPVPTTIEGRDWRVEMDAVVGDYLRDLDAIPHHFQLHLMHAVEIVGYKHPAPTTRAWWLQTYHRLVHDMHLWPETEDQLDRRLGDSREQLVPLSRGRNPRGKCPFHGSKSDSLAVYPEESARQPAGSQMLGVRGWSGDAIKFVEDYFGLTFIDALKQLEARTASTGSTAAPVAREKRRRRAAAASSRSARPRWAAAVGPGAARPGGDRDLFARARRSRSRC